MTRQLPQAKDAICSHVESDPILARAAADLETALKMRGVRFVGPSTSAVILYQIARLYARMPKGNGRYG